MIQTSYLGYRKHKNIRIILKNLFKIFLLTLIFTFLSSSQKLSVKALNLPKKIMSKVKTSEESLLGDKCFTDLGYVKKNGDSWSYPYFLLKAVCLSRMNKKNLEISLKTLTKWEKRCLEQIDSNLNNLDSPDSLNNSNNIKEQKNNKNYIENSKNTKIRSCSLIVKNKWLFDKIAKHRMINNCVIDKAFDMIETHTGFDYNENSYLTRWMKVNCHKITFKQFKQMESAYYPMVMFSKKGYKKNQYKKFLY